MSLLVLNCVLCTITPLRRYVNRNEVHTGLESAAHLSVHLGVSQCII